METINPLTSDPIPKLIRQIAVPSSIGFFFHTMFNVVDTWYAGRISTEALAALSLSFPIYFMVVAVGSGLSSGTTALIATSLGAGRRDAAEIQAAQGLVLGLIVSVVLTGLGLFLSPWLFTLLGASGRYLEISVHYMNTIFSGAVFFIMLNMLNSILNAVGDTRAFRNFLIAGCAANVVLDPWLIYGGLGVPAYGVSGIGLATVVIQAGGCLYLGTRVNRHGLISRPLVSKLIPRPPVLMDIARQGLPATANVATIGLGIFIITWFISRFGQDGVAAYGIAIRIEQVVLMPTIGLNVATLTLVAQNHGAGFFDRVRGVVSSGLKYGGLLTFLGGVLLLILADWLMGFFSRDQAIIHIGATYLRIDAIALYAYVILSVNVSTLQGLKRPMFAVWIGLYRQLAAPLIVYWLLSQVLGWGLNGVWWGIFGVTWSAAGVAAWFGRAVMKGMAIRSSQQVPGR